MFNYSINIVLCVQHLIKRIEFNLVIRNKLV